MPKKTHPAAIVIPLAMLAGGIVFAFTRDAEAGEPDDHKPGPVPDVNGDVEDEDKAKRATIKPTYEASLTRCYRDGESFNVIQWPDPAAVVAGLQGLGFAIGLVELLQSDAVAQTPIFAASSSGYSPGRSDKLKQFQAVARSMGLPGYKDAPASAVDGVIGECTLRSMTAAVELANADAWPYPPALLLQGMTVG